MPARTNACGPNATMNNNTLSAFLAEKTQARAISVRHRDWESRRNSMGGAQAEESAWDASRPNSNGAANYLAELVGIDLSLDTGISQGHLSFVESGRSVPSRDLQSIVSEKLDIPLHERNVLLLASGYSPIYEESSWEVPEMAAVTEAIDRMLLQQEPHPALVSDRYWNVIRANKAAQTSSALVLVGRRAHARGEQWRSASNQEPPGSLSFVTTLRFIWTADWANFLFLV